MIFRLWHVREGSSQIRGDIADETVNRGFGNAVTDDCVHSFSHRAKGRFIEAGEIQLRFGRGERVNVKLGFHERKELREGCGFPFEQQSGGGSGDGAGRLVFDIFDMNPDIGLHSHAPDIDVQFGRHRLRAGTSCLGRCWNTVSASLPRASRTCA